jgi:RNA polymerase sigma-70 factor (ECF subfamily)
VGSDGRGGDEATSNPAGLAPTDAVLVARALEGDRRAQETLFLRHTRMVAGLIYRVFPSNADVDDLVQDTFIAAFESLGRLENPQAFAAWVGSIAIRTTHKRLRRHRIAVRLGLSRREEPDWDSALSPDCPPDVATELRELYRVILDFPTKERVALVLRRVEGMSLQEIAEATGESLATVKRRIAAAEDRLRGFQAKG